MALAVLLFLALGSSEKLLKVIAIDNPCAARWRLLKDMIVVHLCLNRCLSLLIAQMDWIIRLREAKVREGRRPVSLVTNLRDAMHVRH